MISDLDKKRLREILSKYSYTKEEVNLEEIIKNINSFRKYDYKKSYSGFLKLAFSFSAILLIAIILFLNKPDTISINNGKTILKAGEYVKTEREKYEVELKDKSKFIIFENSTFNIISAKDNRTIIELKEGRGHFKITKREKSHFFVKTPSLEITVKGTEFFVWVNNKTEEVHVIEGEIFITNIVNKGSSEIEANEAILFDRDKNIIRKENTDLTRIENIIMPKLSVKKEIKSEKLKKPRYSETKENLIYLDDKTVIFNKKDLYIYQSGDYSSAKRKISLTDNIAKITPYGTIILINGENGGLYAYDLEGEYLWANMEAGIVRFFSKPIIKNDQIYLATVDKGIQIFGLDGRLIDTIKKGDKKAIYNSPVILEDKSIIYLNENGDLTRYDTMTKKNIWQINIEDRVLFPFFERGGVLYLVSKSRSEVLAINVENGEKIWASKIKENLYINNFYIFGDHLILGSDDGITVFNINNGEVERVFNYDFSIKQAITETNRLYLLDTNNRLTIWTIPDFIKVYEKKFTKEVKRISYYNGKILVYGNNFYHEVRD
ncbi:MAG: FecR domain-containing protein [Brevinematales bacterium]|nr:FecR domain-containing protein [Brevinematales bacterium]